MQSNLQRHPHPGDHDQDRSAKADHSVADDQYRKALEHFRSGNFIRARAILAQSLADHPENPKALHLMGLVNYEQGDPNQAVELLRDSIKVNPHAASPYSDLAIILKELGQIEEAFHACMTAISLDPKHHRAYSNLGKLYRDIGKLEEAAVCYQCAVEISPEIAQRHVHLGLTYLALGKRQEALNACEKAAALSPDDTDILLALGKTMRAAGKIEKAIALYECIDTRYQGHVPALCNLASCYAETGDIRKALVTHRRTLELAPELADVHIALGNTFTKLGRQSDALNCYQYAASTTPDHAAAYACVGEAKALLGEDETALEACKKAIAIDAALPGPYVTLAKALARAGQFSEALDVHSRALALDRDNIDYLAGYYQLSRDACRWDGLDKIENTIRSSAGNDTRPTPPSVLREMECSAEELLLCARSWAKKLQIDAQPLATVARREPGTSERINLGYLYGSLCSTNMVDFLAATIKRHDRDRFRVVGFCYNAKNGNGYQARLDEVFDDFIDIGQLCHADAARQIHKAGIDILIDLEGCADGARPEILAHRPAPIQVGYLSHHATMGAGFMDYIIGDAFITPMDQQPFFDEKIVQLADCFVTVPPPDDSSARTVAPDRNAYGLPQGGVVFCCFNPGRTISPDGFAIWMNIMKNVPGSVLWLLDTNPVATKNLKRRAAALGIDPARLIFAAPCSREDHLLRLTAADLYLDTMPSSCGAAIADALAVGVPVLTCAGETTPSRLTGSLLRSCNLSDMITYATEHYEHVAKHLARTPKNLAEIRNRLSSRLSTPLFDSGNYQCGLDAAYEHMAAISSRGEHPYAFAVAMDEGNSEDACDERDSTPPLQTGTYGRQ